MTTAGLKKFVRGMVGESLTGILEYLTFRDARRSWEGAFNGQQCRQRMFEEIIGAGGFVAVVETGTFHGATTHYLHSTSHLPVYSAELQKRFLWYARTRFLFRPGIHLVRSDARDFLRTLVSMESLAAGRVFFYLDAHWDDDVREEVRIIFDGCPNAVVMIDDFQVPGDPGYGYDTYGESSALTLDYLKPQIGRGGLAVFFPSAASGEETGAKRGCVVLARSPDIVGCLRDMRLLAFFNEGNDV